MLLCLLLLAPPLAATHTATVEAFVVRQRVEGFGGAIAYYGNYLVRHPYKDDILKALFDPTEGLGINLLRVQNFYRFQTGADFDKDTAEIVAAANRARGSAIPLLMTSWSPPASLKSNGSETCGGTDDCTLARVDGKYDYQGFANYWAESLDRYRAVGVSPRYISIQNEPDFHADWNSCRFNPTEAPFEGKEYAGYDRALAAVRGRLSAMEDAPQIIGPETIGVGFGHLRAYLSAVSFDIVAHHLYTGGTEAYPDSYNLTLQQARQAAQDKLTFQTEFGKGGALETAGLIHNALTTEEVNAYFVWGLVWPDREQLIYIDNPYDSREKWSEEHGWRLNDVYYALKHFSYFIQPGFQRVNTRMSDGLVKMSAFVSPDGKRLVMVFVNPIEEDAMVRLDLRLSYFVKFAVGQMRVFRTDFTSDTERFSQVDPPEEPQTAWVPGKSIVTVVVDRP